MTALAMILDVAARHPGRAAIECADGSVVTYAQLVDDARHFAPASDVAEIDAVRSAELIARCLGAWMAGRAFFPIDRTDPRPRPRVDAAGLAYVIATSGSTGAPKLVMVGSRGLPALLRTQIDAFALAPGARSLWLHSPLFDASISDWGTALASGATLVIPTDGALDSPARLRDELGRRAITHVDLPPSLLVHVEPAPAALRVVVLGGEPCDVDRVRALARSGVRVVVVYGPTEATVCSSLAVVDPARWDRPYIGQPLPGIEYRVVDGELYIVGDDALAVGYAGDDAETQRRFVTLGSKRAYRTGDRVEHAAQGLAFVGRVDRQRKVRGRRVELDAIEAELRRHVTDAAVVVRDERIVAFATEPVDRTALALPAWMLPSRVVVGPLPRTPTGKLDRAALEQRELPIAHVEPLAVAWCRVLGVERVEPGDRWSAAGGDSLARLMFHAATGITIEGDPAFCELADAGPSALAVEECEARGLAIAAGIARSGPRSAGDAVLVTGATGFLGRALVRALTREGRHVIALVRDLSHVAIAGDVVRGDVARPYFGMSQRAWCALRERVGEVIHCAAAMQLGGTWKDHVAANVHGTAEVAAFAGDDIPWHHVSTLSVFVNTDRRRGRHTPASLPAGIAYGGYAQTKIAAEAIARGRAATIYRLGLLVGAGARGQLPMTVRGLAKLGCVPAGMRDARFDTTPVEYAADRVAHVRRGIIHIASATGMTCGELADRMQLAEVERAAWLSRARERAHDADIAMTIAAFSGEPDRELFLASGADFDSAAPAFDIIEAYR